MERHIIKQTIIIKEIQRRFHKIQRLTKELKDIDECVNCTNNLSDDLLKVLVQSNEKEIKTRRHNIKQMILMHARDINRRLDELDTSELTVVGKMIIEKNQTHTFSF